MTKKLLLERTALGKICAFVFCDTGFLGWKRKRPAERTQKRKKALLACCHSQLLPWHFYKESWAVIVSTSRQTWGSINKKVIIILIIITTQMITMRVIIIKALLCLSPSFAHPLNLLNVQKLGVSIHSALSSNCIWFGRHNFNHNIRKRGESCGVLIVGYY